MTLATEYYGETPAPLAPPVASGHLTNWVIACVSVFSLLAAWAMVVRDIRHWMLFPLFVCGVLTTVDAVRWMRGQFSLFDPVGILGLLGIHFFFLAPLLHITWDMWMAYVDPLSKDDWRKWLGYMAMLNAGCLIVYRGTRNWMPARAKSTTLRLPSTGFMPMLIGAMLVTLLAQIVVYIRFGGLMGYIQAHETEHAQFVGMGWLFAISEAFPILAMLGWAVYQQRRGQVPSWFTIIVVLMIFFVLKLLFGGLRGSRSTTVWGLFWAVGIVHLLVRQIPKTLVYAGIVFLLGFLYVYGFYKAKGLEGFGALTDASARSSLQRVYGRTFRALLLGDLGRSDVQAYVLARVATPGSDYDLAHGRSFLGAVTMLVPKQIWPDRPPTKLAYGTRALYGRHHERAASNVYGLGGEWMLNFGPAGVLPGYALLGLLVAWVRRYEGRLLPGDLRWALVPMLVNLCFSALVGDSDNLVFFLIKDGSIPALIVYVGSVKLFAPRGEYEAATAVEH